LNHKVYPSTNNLTVPLLTDTPKILDKTALDPFSDYASSPYIYKLSPNKQYYLVYSVGALGNTQAKISDTGKVTFPNGDPEYEKWVSNGKL
jgi:hypothetical protein